MKTRCKFYVTTVTESANQSGGSWSRVTLNAAYSAKPGTENHAFWKASPNGKMEFGISAEEAAKFKPGSYWYIDSEPVPNMNLEVATEEERWNWIKEQMKDPSVWRLSSIGRPYQGNLTVRLSNNGTCFGTGFFEVSIDNRSAWAPYHSLDLLFRLTFSPAEKD